MTPWPNKSPEPTAVGACSLRSQRRHESVAQQETFASRTVVAIAVHSRGPSAKTRHGSVFYVRRLRATEC
jgi:hypothetical protein